MISTLKKTKKTRLSAVMILILIMGHLTLYGPTALAAENYKLTLPLPTEKAGEMTTTIAGPAEFIIAVYRFAWAIALLLAMLMIVIGAIKYSTSGGDVGRIGDAKSQILSAIWGVALLLGAYLLLYTINPSLVSLKNPKLELISEPPSTLNETISYFQKRATEEFTKTEPINKELEDLRKQTANAKIESDKNPSDQNARLNYLKSELLTKIIEIEKGAAQYNGYTSQQRAILLEAQQQGTPIIADADPQLRARYDVTNKARNAIVKQRKELTAETEKLQAEIKTLTQTIRGW